jgi:hypothetical protein
MERVPVMPSSKKFLNTKLETDEMNDMEAEACAIDGESSCPSSSSDSSWSLALGNDRDSKGLILYPL